MRLAKVLVFAMALAPWLAHAATDDTKPIHQEIDFKASPEKIYQALTDSKQFTKASGAPAEISSDAGGTFSCFGGMILGRNIELVANKRIVQAWRVKEWPEGVYSIARFELTPKGSGTKIIFDHSAFPAGARDHLDEGWHRNYWKPLKKLFGE